MADSHFFQQFPKTSGGRPKLQTEAQAQKHGHVSPAHRTVQHILSPGASTLSRRDWVGGV